MIRFFKTPYFLQKIYPSLIWNSSQENTIHLTFDDGPDPEVTPWVLDELERVKAKGSFFCVGRNLQGNEALVGRMTAAGHLVGNHTYDHVKGSDTSVCAYMEDVQKCTDSLEALAVSTRFFRPPYGKIKRSQISALADKRIVMWSHLSYDFDSNVDVKKSISALKKARSGSIITFHDSVKAFKNLKKILPELLEFYVSKGYCMKTLIDD